MNLSLPNNFMSISLLYFEGPRNESCTLSNVMWERSFHVIKDVNLFMHDDDPCHHHFAFVGKDGPQNGL